MINKEGGIETMDLNKLKEIQAVVFDMDGLMFDSERYVQKSWDIAGERLGTVFMYRNDKPYDIEDIIVSEYGTTVVGLEMMRAVHEENAEEDRKQQVVKSAFNTLSF